MDGGCRQRGEEGERGRERVGEVRMRRLRSGESQVSVKRICWKRTRIRDARIVRTLPAHDDVDAAGERAVLRRDALPALTPHDDRIHGPSVRNRLGDLGKVGHLLREPPWERRRHADAVRRGRGDDQSERHLHKSVSE